MTKLEVINQEFIDSRGVFKTISPGFSSLFIGDVGFLVKAGIKFVGLAKDMRSIYLGKPIAEVVGERIGNRIIGFSTRPIKKAVLKAHQNAAQIAVKANETVKARTWIDQPGKQTMVIIYHDANKAGAHIDIHIGQLSVIYRVKPELAEQLKFNNKGMLTEASKRAIIKHVRNEISNRSRVPQNLDHTPQDARESWVDGDPGDKRYGAGKTRQIVNESIVDVYKASKDGPIEFYAPLLNPSRAMYIHKLYPGDGKRAPILIWGNKAHRPPRLEDRLHLRLVHPENMDKLLNKTDMATSTAKYDGASCYVVIGPKGTTVWSPRVSSRTGEQIEYTLKLNGIGGVTSPDLIVGMGEILFTKDGTKGYLPSSTIGGILNAQQVLPDDVKSEIRLYRIDRVGRVNTKNLPFWENRILQEEVASLNPEMLKVVELMSPVEAAEKGFEGVVTVPPDASINEGFKVKWWGDPCDWRIDSIDFRPGPKGGIAGVVNLTSLESGKQFKLGPGQIGTRELCETMMKNPEQFIGSVVKVNSRQGHEGRASKVLGFHQDKGVAPDLPMMIVKAATATMNKRGFKRGDKFTAWNPKGSFDEKYVIRQAASNHDCLMCSREIEAGTNYAKTEWPTYKSGHKYVHIDCIRKLQDVIRS